MRLSMRPTIRLPSAVTLGGGYGERSLRLDGDVASAKRELGLERSSGSISCADIVTRERRQLSWVNIYSSLFTTNGSIRRKK